MPENSLTTADLLDAALEGILEIGAGAASGGGGCMDDDAWAAIQHVLDMAEVTEQRANESRESAPKSDGLESHIPVPQLQHRNEKSWRDQQAAALATFHETKGT